jgi:hypothetical protein
VFPAQSIPDKLQPQPDLHDVRRSLPQQVADRLGLLEDSLSDGFREAAVFKAGRLERSAWGNFTGYWEMHCDTSRRGMTCSPHN